MEPARPGARALSAGDAGSDPAGGYSATVREADGTETLLTFRAGDKVRPAGERVLLRYGGSRAVTHGEIVAVEPGYADALILRWADDRGPFRWTTRVDHPGGRGRGAPARRGRPGGRPASAPPAG